MAAHPGLDVSPNVFVARDGFEHGLKMDSYLIDEGWTRLSRDWLNEHERQETYDERPGHQEPPPGSSTRAGPG